MDEQRTCGLCGEQFPASGLYSFDGLELCPHCLDTRTLICRHCEERIWEEDNAGSTDTPLCRDCFDDHYTHCSACGCLLHESNAYYDDSDEYDERPYEMCSGVSLVSELAALVYKLDQLNKQRVFLPSDEDESAKWMDCFRDSIYDALEYNAEKISACPAVYWRIAHLKRIIYEVNTICQNLDESRRLQRPVPYGCEAPLSMGPLPTTQRDWINMGIDIFNQMISAFPEPLTFWDKDSQQFSNISCDNDNSDSISGVMAANAKLRSSPRIGASKGARPYLAYCLSDAEPYVKKLKKAAADNSAKDMSFKLRHEGGVKNVFTEIHRRLYGGNTGFKYIETI